MTCAKDHSELDALNREDRAALSKDPNSKVRDLDVESLPVLETLTPLVRKRVELLRELQSQHNELVSSFLAEREELEAKYQELYKPLYSKRFEIVNGLTEVEGSIGDGDDDAEIAANAQEVKGVPNFWLNAMKTNEVLAEEITDRDEGALHYLEDIKWSRVHACEGFRGFWLEFFFNINPYFKNLVLKKAYHMVDEDEPILEKAIGTKIEWYPGKCLTQKRLKKKSRRGGKIITKTEKCDSFFHFFNPPQVPEDGDDLDEDAAEDLQNEMDMDYEIGITIRDKIIPHAVSWFTGEAAEGDEFEAVDDDDDDDDEEDSEDDEEEEGDEDEEEDKAKGRKK